MACEPRFPPSRRPADRCVVVRHLAYPQALHLPCLLPTKRRRVGHAVHHEREAQWLDHDADGVADLEVEMGRTGEGDRASEAVGGDVEGHDDAQQDTVELPGNDGLVGLQVNRLAVDHEGHVRGAEVHGDARDLGVVRAGDVLVGVGRVGRGDAGDGDGDDDGLLRLDLVGLCGGDDLVFGRHGGLECTDDCDATAAGRVASDEVHDRRTEHEHDHGEGSSDSGGGNSKPADHEISPLKSNAVV